MTRHDSAKSLAQRSMGRRSLLGVLGAAPVAVGAGWVLSGSADAVGAGSSGSSGPAGSSGAGGATGPKSASGKWSVPPALRPNGELDQFLAQQAAQDAFSGTVLVAHGDRTVLTRSFGMADKAKSIPNGTDTIYCLASVTKLFTAVAIAQLVQQGSVKYEGTLGSYLGGFAAEAADHVTVHQLLTHTSGLGDYFKIDGFFDAAAGWTTADQVLSGTLDFIRKAPLMFTPGTGHTYSNSAYAVLGGIVQQVSGQSYYDYIRQHVFAPAGMTSSDFYTRPQWQSDRRLAHPYSRPTPGPRVDIVNQEQLFIGLPDGNAFATAPDLVRFARALLGGRLLEPAYIELYNGAKFPAGTLPAKPGLPAKVLYEAYGPAVTLRNGKWAVGHNGGNAGISTFIEWYPGTEWVAVKLSNYDPQDTMMVDNEIEGILTR
ncbi:serine hydrolase domain-containing protein [Catenulispora yoronensis]|uniref:Serine hydrolase domain-containing protein n=1 Tax=Catenulispora yoronensis TaxID=450799 RepID=A0ABN2VLA6_9ACTN